MKIFLKEEKPSTLITKESGHIRGNGMEEMNVNLIHAANYLIQMFFKTGKKYSCTRTKIGKMLTLVAFGYAQDNKQLFSEPIYKYDGCGTAIRKIMDTYDRDIYVQCGDNDNQKCIDDKFNDEFIDLNYDDYATLDDDVKKRIEEVFRKFGAYSSSRLGECITLIINCPGVTEADGTINLSKICGLKRSDIQNKPSETITVINYLFQ